MIQSGLPLRIRLFSLDQCGVVLSPQDLQSAAKAAGIALPIKSTEALYDALLFEAKEPAKRQQWLDKLAAIIDHRASDLLESSTPYPAATALLEPSIAKARAVAAYLRSEAAHELA